MKTRYLPVVVGTSLGSDRVGLLENVIFEKVLSAEEASKAVAVQNLFFLSDSVSGEVLNKITVSVTGFTEIIPR